MPEVNFFHAFALTCREYISSGIWHFLLISKSTVVLVLKIFFVEVLGRRQVEELTFDLGHPNSPLSDVNTNHPVSKRVLKFLPKRVLLFPWKTCSKRILEPRFSALFFFFSEILTSQVSNTPFRVFYWRGPHANVRKSATVTCSAAKLPMLGERREINFEKLLRDFYSWRFAIQILIFFFFKRFFSAKHLLLSENRKITCFSWWIYNFFLLVHVVCFIGLLGRQRVCSLLCFFSSQLVLVIFSHLIDFLFIKTSQIKIRLFVLCRSLFKIFTNWKRTER